MMLLSKMMGWRKVINRIKAERIPTPTPATRCKTRPNFTPRVNACSGPGSHASACARSVGTPAAPSPHVAGVPLPGPSALLPTSPRRCPARASPPAPEPPSPFCSHSTGADRAGVTVPSPRLPAAARPHPSRPHVHRCAGRGCRRRRLRPPRLPHRSPETPAQLRRGLISALGLISRHARARPHTVPYNSLLLGAEQGARLLSARVAGAPWAPSSSERVA